MVAEAEPTFPVVSGMVCFWTESSQRSIRECVLWTEEAKWSAIAFIGGRVGLRRHHRHLPLDACPGPSSAAQIRPALRNACVGGSRSCLPRLGGDSGSVGYDGPFCHVARSRRGS